jgi:phytoene dehydrogenase-like protein
MYKSFFKNPLKNSEKFQLLCMRHYVSNSQLVNDIAKIKKRYDVIIIGAGHNGLVAANYLAKFSKKKLKICLLEQRHLLGGAAVTEELYPGFKFSRASYLLSLFRPTILKELDLMRHGILKFYTRNPSSYTPLLESDPQYKKARSLTLSSDLAYNKSQILKFSKEDAKNYGNYEDWLNEICSLLEPFIDNPCFDPKQLDRKNLLKKINYARSYISSIKTAKSFINNYKDIYRLFTESAANILDDWFESDVLKATLATDSVIGAMLSPYSNGSAYVLLHHMIGSVDGRKGVWAYVEGGMGSISKTLALNAKQQDVDMFTSQKVI